MKREMNKKQKHHKLKLSSVKRRALDNIYHLLLYALISNGQEANFSPSKRTLILNTPVSFAK